MRAGSLGGLGESGESSRKGDMWLADVRQEYPRESNCFNIQEIEPKASFMPRTCSTTELHQGLTVSTLAWNSL